METERLLTSLRCHSQETAGQGSNPGLCNFPRLCCFCYAQLTMLRSSSSNFSRKNFNKDTRGLKNQCCGLGLHQQIGLVVHIFDNFIYSYNYKIHILEKIFCFYSETSISLIPFNVLFVSSLPILVYDMERLYKKLQRNQGCILYKFILYFLVRIRSFFQSTTFSPLSFTPIIVPLFLF